MASSGSFSRKAKKSDGTYSSTLSIRCDWSDSTSVANNTSTITAKVYAVNNNSYATSGTLSGALVFNGESKSFSKAISVSSSTGAVLVATITFSAITHNTDGTKSITAYFTSGTGISGTSGWGGGTDSTAESITLDTIARASSFSSIPTFTIGSAGTISISRASSSFTHTITYSFGSYSGTVGTGIATSVSWTPPTTLYNALPSSTSGTGTLTLTTYNGSTKIGTATASFTAQVGSSVVPSNLSITLSLVNTNTWINSKGIAVAGYTKLRAVSSASAGTGSSMKSYTLSGAFTGSGTDVTSGVITSSGSKTVTLTALDNRGRSATKTSSAVTFLAYSNPAITLSAARNATTQSTIEVGVTVSLSLTDNGNTCSTSVTCNGTTQTFSGTSGSLTFTGTDTSTSYVVSVTTTDSVGNSITVTKEVSTIAVPLCIDVVTPAIGIGKVAETAKTVELADDWKMIGNVLGALISPSGAEFHVSTSKSTGSSGSVTFTHTAGNGVFLILGETNYGNYLGYGSCHTTDSLNTISNIVDNFGNTSASVSDNTITITARTWSLFVIVSIGCTFE